VRVHNKGIAASISQSAGVVGALGLCGLDAGLIKAKQRNVALGLVGKWREEESIERNMCYECVHVLIRTSDSAAFVQRLISDCASIAHRQLSAVHRLRVDCLSIAHRRSTIAQRLCGDCAAMVHRDSAEIV
jgi:hypothetical protein